MRTKPRKIRFTLSKKQRAQYRYYYDLWHGILQDEIDAHDSIFVVYVGKRGAGKSTCAIKDALTLDPQFSAEQIGFRKEEVIDAIQELAYSGTHRVVIFDEFGAEMMARNWWNESQKALVAALQSIRDTKVTLFACMPHLKFGDYVAESLGNFCVEVQSPAHMRIPYRMGKALESFGFYSTRKARKFTPIWLDGEIFHIPYINPISQHEELFDTYWAKKRTFITELLEQEESPRSQPSGGLTKRELEYLQLINQELSISQIALRLDVTEGAVSKMKRTLRKKGALPEKEAVPIYDD